MDCEENNFNGGRVRSIVESIERIAGILTAVGAVLFAVTSLIKVLLDEEKDE
jgi:hypothetical protein